MAELIERYVHQVGRYLPDKERADIEAELRSMIHDQLEDRYDGRASDSDVARVLMELGAPRKMAASYSGERYLIGPDLYPIMMKVLRYGWVLVPAVTVFLTVLGVLLAAQPSNWIELLLAALFGAIQATFIFSAVVVLIFAILQHSGTVLKMKDAPFDPLTLPDVNDPHTVDRAESASGIAIGTFTTLALLYWLRVGGLTLRFDLSNPGEVIPVPAVWHVVLIVVIVLLLGLNLLALARNRWTLATWCIETGVELIGAVALYFVLFLPLQERLLSSVPTLANIPLAPQAAAIFTIISAVFPLISNGVKLIRLWNYRLGAA
jgi:hypothetical protein